MSDHDEDEGPKVYRVPLGRVQYGSVDVEADSEHQADARATRLIRVDPNDDRIRWNEKFSTPQPVMDSDEMIDEAPEGVRCGPYVVGDES